MDEKQILTGTFQSLGEPLLTAFAYGLHQGDIYRGDIWTAVQPDVWWLYEYRLKKNTKKSMCNLQTPFSVSQESGSDSQHSWKFSKKGDFTYTTKTSKWDLL